MSVYIVNPELTFVTGTAVDEPIQTPYALRSLTLYHHHSIKHQLEGGWKFLRWHWSSHYPIGHEDAYPLVYLGQRFRKNKPLSLEECRASWKNGRENCYYYNNYDGSSGKCEMARPTTGGCSDTCVGAFKDLMKMDAKNIDRNSACYSYSNSRHLAYYYGPPLSADELAKAHGNGWVRILGTNILIFGHKPSELPAKWQKCLK